MRKSTQVFPVPNPLQRKRKYEVQNNKQKINKANGNSQ